MITKKTCKITLEVEYEIDNKVYDQNCAEDAIKIYTMAEMTMCDELIEKGINVLNVKIE